MRTISKWKAIKVACITAGVLILSTGCGATSENSGANQQRPQTAGVNWDNYPPLVKSRTSQLITERDCSSLRKEFDNSYANDANQRNRVGEGNANLMTYIDDALKSSDCAN